MDSGKMWCLYILFSSLGNNVLSFLCVFCLAFQSVYSLLLWSHLGTLTHTQMGRYRYAALSGVCVAVQWYFEPVQHLEMLKPLLSACLERTSVLLCQVMCQQNTGLHRDGGRC